MTDRLATLDMAHILHCLRGGPITCGEIAITLRLTHHRTNGLLLELAKKQLIHAPRCTLNAKGVNVNLWELRTTTMESAP